MSCSELGGGRAVFAKTGPSVRRAPSSTSSLRSASSARDTHTFDSFISLENTATMSDDEERVTMPFKFVTGEYMDYPLSPSER